MTKAAFINPQAEQIKLSACKCHLVCVCVKFCSAVDFSLKEVTFPFPFSLQSCFSSLFSVWASETAPLLACTSQVDWINSSVFTFYLLTTKRTLIHHTALLSQKKLHQFRVGHCLWGNNTSRLLYQVILVSSVLTWPLANALLHVWIFCPVFPQPVCRW